MSMSIDGDTDGTEAEAAKPRADRDTRTILAPPAQPPPKVSLDELVRRTSEICLKAIDCQPKQFAKSLRGIYADALRSFGATALNAVYLITMEAYRLRESPKEQRDKLGSLLAFFAISASLFSDAEEQAALYQGEAGDKIVNDYIKKVSDILAGIIEEPEWQKIPQERITNELTKPNQFLPLVEVVDPCAETAKLKYNNLIMTANKNTLIGLNTITYQFLDFLLLKAHRVGNFKVISISVAEYMRARGLKSRKEAKQQMDKAISDLYSISLEYDISELKKKDLKKLPKLFPISGKFRIIEAETRVKRGDATILFGTMFSPYIAAATPMEYHSSLLKINSHLNPNSHVFGRKILERVNMEINKAHKEGGGGKHEVLLSVATLLRISSLPGEDKVKEKLQGRYYQYIISPFERDLNALADMGRWEYCKARGEPLPPSDDPKKYSTFKELYVRFTFNSYPQPIKTGAAEIGLRRGE